MTLVSNAESPFLSLKAGREFQAIVADRLSWLEWVTLGPAQPSLFASELYFKKGIFSWGKSKLGKYFPNLFKKELPHLHRPNPEKDHETYGHAAYDAWLFEYLRTDWNSTYKEIGETGSFLGYLAGYLSGNLNLPNETIENMSLEDYDKAFKYKVGVGLDNLNDLESKLDKNKERIYAANYAKREGSKWIAVYDEMGERSGRPYEIISQMYRDKISESIEQGKTLEELQSSMAYPDLFKLVDDGKITSDEYLSITKDSKTQMRLNRNFQRFAYTEASYAFSNGRLQALHEAGQNYVIFTRGSVTL